MSPKICSCIASQITHLVTTIFTQGLNNDIFEVTFHELRIFMLQVWEDRYSSHMNNGYYIQRPSLVSPSINQYDQILLYFYSANIS